MQFLICLSRPSVARLRAMISSHTSLLIPISAAAYLFVIYLLLTLAQRVSRVPRARE